MTRIVGEYESRRGTVDPSQAFIGGDASLKEGIAMKKLLIPVLALGLLGSAAAVTAPAPASAAAVVVKIGGGGVHHRHRRHVCGAWGWRHHVRYCRVWRWRWY
jgi:hypothetical protein